MEAKILMKAAGRHEGGSGDTKAVMTRVDMETWALLDAMATRSFTSISRLVHKAISRLVEEGLPAGGAREIPAERGKREATITANVDRELKDRVTALAQESATTNSKLAAEAIKWYMDLVAPMPKPPSASI